MVMVIRVIVTHPPFLIPSCLSHSLPPSLSLPVCVRLSYLLGTTLSAVYERVEEFVKSKRADLEDKLTKV